MACESLKYITLPDGASSTNMHNYLHSTYSLVYGVSHLVNTAHTIYCRERFNCLSELMTMTERTDCKGLMKSLLRRLLCPALYSQMLQCIWVRIGTAELNFASRLCVQRTTMVQTARYSARQWTTVGNVYQQRDAVSYHNELTQLYLCLLLWQQNINNQLFS